MHPCGSNPGVFFYPRHDLNSLNYFFLVGAVAPYGAITLAIKQQTYRAVEWNKDGDNDDDD